MPQESTAINTQNSAGTSGFFGSLFGGISNLITSAAPVAANLYSLKMQGDTLKGQLASQQPAAVPATAKPSTAGGVDAIKPWMIWTGVGVVVLLVIVLLRGRK